ncbi:MAG: linear amide C-N hydrolase [Bacteroidales bacterium]|nr:linear amide C-N hydrolase [Bacteroidales bacterium]
MKKALKWFFGVVLGFCLVAVVVVTCVWHHEISTIRSIRQVGDNPYLYYMEYKTPYDLDELVSKDAASNDDLVAYVVAKIGKGLPIKIKSSQVKDENGELGTFNCTSFQARKADGSGYFYGRNYDYFKNPTLVVRSRPENGYASLAVTDMSHVGYSLEKLPASMLSKVMCLAAIYAPVDGMNEKGLCTSIMALPKMASQQNTEKHDVGTSVIMRLFLDRCATVQEAIDLANSVDIRHDTIVGSGYHYMVADASGDCAVIEFDKEDGWKTMIVRKSPDSTYMHVTNHLLSPKYYTTEPDQSVGNTKSKSWWRYKTVLDYLSEKKGCITFDEAQECLSLVRWVDLKWEGSTTVEDTQWSSVYDQSMGTLSLRNWNDYEKTCTFYLNE